uniref:Uncharacterized protein n=1 Tax=Ditylenchus dipsaci TaxID=166011 RepID=A0A915EC02_9BILA
MEQSRTGAGFSFKRVPMENQVPSVLVVQKCLPESKLDRAFFICKSLSLEGAKELYDNNEAFLHEVNLILALAFTPIEEVSMAFFKLREYLEDSAFAEQMEPILDIFED